MTDNKYQNGKIYMIKSSFTNKIYIGSTLQKYLSNRFKEHKYCLKSYEKGNKTSYCTSYEIVKYDDAQIILVENYPCNSKDELRAREEYHRKQYNEAINKQKAFQSHKEHLQYMREWHHDNKEYVAKRAKEYRETHKEDLQVKKKQYHEKNAEQIKARQNARDICPDCGKEYSHSNKNVHLKSKYHLENSKKQDQANEIKQTA